MKNSTDEFCIMKDNPPYWRNKRIGNLHKHEAFFGDRPCACRTDALCIVIDPAGGSVVGQDKA